MMDFGLVSFGDMAAAPDGRPLSQAHIIRDVVEQGVLADRSGIDFFGLGEHHRSDYAISSPEMVLAAIAGRTERVRLGSAATVLSTDNPVRVFQRFSTLQAISGGRAEITVGRGVSGESFALFGYDLERYAELFEDKLSLLAALMSDGPTSWKGWTGSELRDQRVFPEIEAARPPVWIAVGGDPRSLARAARYRMPVMLAILGGPAARFAAHLDRYREHFVRLGQPVPSVGVCSLGYVAETDAVARREYYPDYKRMRDRAAKEHGWPFLTEVDFEEEIEKGALYVGSPETVARKIADTAGALNIDRFALRYSAGPLPHDKMVRCISLFGSEVAALARDLVS